MEYQIITGSMKVQVKKDNISGPAMRLGRGGRDRLEASDLYLPLAVTVTLRKSYGGPAVEA